MAADHAKMRIEIDKSGGSHAILDFGIDVTEYQVRYLSVHNSLATLQY